MEAEEEAEMEVEDGKEVVGEGRVLMVVRLPPSLKSCSRPPSICFVLKQVKHMPK